MPMMFDNLEAAVAWLNAHGWTQFTETRWRKEGRRADINRLPGRNPVSVVIKRESER